MAHQEPTPENYARAYAEESGLPPTVMPERARSLLDKVLARSGDDSTKREELLGALMNGRWDQAAAAIDRGGNGAAAQGEAWALLVERLVRNVQRGSKQWTAARKK